MKSIQVAVISLVVLNAAFSTTFAATVDTINGSVTDSVSNLPIDSVAVGSGGFSALTKTDGTFSLVFSSTQLMQKGRQELMPGVAWRAQDGSFSWAGYSGSISIEVNNLKGGVVAQYSSWKGPQQSTFSLANLPKGIYCAVVKAQGRAEVYKIMNLKSGEGRSSVLITQNTGARSAGLFKTMATTQLDTLTFTKAGYTTATLAVAAGAQTSVSVKLSPAGPGTAASVFNGKTLNGWVSYPAGAFTVNTADTAITETGSARAFLYLNAKYTYYRIIFTLRQITAPDAHYPCVLFFGTSTTADAMAAVQFQLPGDWGWDYRPGKNNSGSAYIKGVAKVPNLNLKTWARCELLVNAATGTARAAVAQPVGTKAIEVVDFHDAAIPNVPSYFAIQCHTKGDIDEYKDITIEVNPKVNDLITTK